MLRCCTWHAPNGEWEFLLALQRVHRTYICPWHKMMLFGRAMSHLFGSYLVELAAPPVTMSRYPWTLVCSNQFLEFITKKKCVLSQTGQVHMYIQGEARHFPRPLLLVSTWHYWPNDEDWGVGLKGIQLVPCRQREQIDTRHLAVFPEAELQYPRPALRRILVPRGTMCGVSRLVSV